MQWAHLSCECTFRAALKGTTHPTDSELLALLDRCIGLYTVALNCKNSYVRVSRLVSSSRWADKIMPFSLKLRSHQAICVALQNRQWQKTPASIYNATLRLLQCSVRQCTAWELQFIDRNGLHLYGLQDETVCYYNWSPCFTEMVWTLLLLSRQHS